MRQLTTSEPKISSDCVTKTFLEGHHSVLQTNLPEGRKVYIFWNILKVLWLKRFELLSFCRLGRPTPSRSKSPSNISLHINAGPPLHYTRSEWQQEFLILCWYKVLMHCSVTQKCSVYSILWWSKILCVCVLNSVALLQNPISKGMCERLCVKVKPQGALTQAEDPVKCFIFRCIKLFRVLLSRTLSTGTPLSSTFFNCT